MYRVINKNHKLIGVIAISDDKFKEVSQKMILKEYFLIKIN